MNRSIRCFEALSPLHRRLRAGCLAALAGLAVACGSGGVGSGGTGAVVGFADGTVTGLGSVVVDGVTFDTDGATVQVEQGPGVFVDAALKLGQHVEVDFESEGVAKAVRVEAQLTGAVTAVAADAVTVLNQIIRPNLDPASGPVTLFEGVASLTDLQVGDIIEVHGLTQRDGAGGFFVRATRIEKQAALPAVVRLVGVVADLQEAGGQPAMFRVGGLLVQLGQDTLIVPRADLLADGRTVVVFGALATPAGAEPRLEAQTVRVKERRNAGIEGLVAGTLSQLDAVAGTFEVNGVLVRFDGATRITPGNAQLANGQYVQVRGNFADADGSLAATRIRVRNTADEGEVELRGTITAFDAGTQVATVRDVPVLTAGAQLQGCPGTGLAAGLFVEVQAAITAQGVVAARIECRGADTDPPGAQVERLGVAGSVDLGARRFTLTPAAGAPLPVRWNGATRFLDGLTPESLEGQPVAVTGVLANGVLIAKRVLRDD